MYKGRALALLMNTGPRFLEHAFGARNGVHQSAVVCPLDSNAKCNGEGLVEMRRGNADK